MNLRDEGQAAQGWTREALAGCTGALVVLPVLLTLGLLAYLPLGAAAPQAGLLAAFITAGIGGLLHAMLSRTSLPVAGPSSPTALTLVPLVVQLAADPALAPGSVAGVQGIVALCGLSLLLAGALQIGLAMSGVARLARVVPQPVLAGFMNSAAVLVVLAQLPLLLDLPLGTKLGADSLRGAHPVALALGLGTAAFIWLLARRWPRLPAALLGLVAGTVAHALCVSLFGASAGASIGPLPPAWPWTPGMLPLIEPRGAELLSVHLPTVLLTALALATIGALESSLNVRAVDQLLNTRHDPRHELIVLGLCNLTCGLLGGLPLAATRTRALATLQAGGRGRIAMRTGPVALGLLYALGGTVLAQMPLPVLAGVMLTVALGLADRWTGRQLARWWTGNRSSDLALSLGVVLLVVGATLWRGMSAGIGLGVLLSLVAFAMRMNRPLMHDRYLASARPSRRIYPVPVEARLSSLREAIEVFELDGALFFGSADRLLDDADTLGGGRRCLVIDLRRVSAIDESGAVALQQVLGRLQARGVHVALAGLNQGSAPAASLRSFGLQWPQWPDADRAIESMEQRLLIDAGDEGDVRAMAELPLAASSLMSGMDANEVAVVASKMQVRSLAAGEMLFGEGDPGDRLYVVCKGSVSILSQPDRLGRAQRYVSVSPGMMIGETAMLDGGGRSAGAVADADTQVHALTMSALEEIGRTHPDLAIRLYRNVALHLSQRLRAAAGAWRSSSR